MVWTGLSGNAPRPESAAARLKSRRLKPRASPPQNCKSERRAQRGAAACSFDRGGAARVCLAVVSVEYRLALGFVSYAGPEARPLPLVADARLQC